MTRQKSLISATLTVVVVWSAYLTLAACAVDGWYVSVGASLATAGIRLLALTILLPDWGEVLRSLDRPLNIAPTTDTMLFALRTYVGVRLDFARASWVLGTLLLLAGLSVQEWRVAVHTRRPGPAERQPIIDAGSPGAP
jgi:hypothetical protein